MGNTAMMPAFFLGHGNPMNAVSKNTYTAAWTALGRSVPRPKVVLAISAHWYIPGTAVTAMATPRTIHDFGGFPDKLFQVQYPATGSPELAKRVSKMLAPLNVGLDERWGLDHGTWAVLCHVFPKADIPIVQLSINETKPPQFHYDIGRKLLPLREEGVLIVGSGNLVHNLHAYAWGRRGVGPYDWAARFEKHARNVMTAGNDASLIDYGKMGPDASLSIPTPDHYLPLLYVLGARQPGEQATFPVEGMDGGSISMLAVQVG
jgi:4,5-DOPA dioxygenase extradiol